MFVLREEAVQGIGDAGGTDRLGGSEVAASERRVDIAVTERRISQDNRKADGNAAALD